MFKTKPNEHNLKIHMKKKTKMDKPLDADYYQKKKLIKVAKLPPQLPNKSFCWFLVGAPGSGKSTYIESLLTAPTVNGKRQSYIGLFDKIIIFTPQIEDFENEDLTELPDIYSELTVENLEEAETMATELYNEGKQTLMVFDDVGSDLRASKQVERKIAKMIFNHRHMGVSMMYCVQTYRSLSPDMRKSGRFLTIFGCDNIQERDVIFEDLPIRKDNHDALYQFVFENKDDEKKVDNLGRKLRHTLYIDKSKKKHPRIVYYKDFDEIETKG